MRTALVFIAVTATGCGISTIAIDEPIPEQTIAGSSLPNPLDAFFQFPIELEIRQQLEAMETGPASSVRLTRIVISITDTAQPAGDTDDWAFVESIDVFVASTMDGTDLPTVKVAEVRDPGAVTDLEFTIIAGVELLPYVNEGVEMTANSTGDTPADDVSFDGSASFAVNLI